MPETIFRDVDHALRWATEVQRKRRFASIAGFYREATPDQQQAIQRFAGHQSHLPTDRTEQVLLAQDVYQACQKLPAEDKKLLMAYYWGDYVDAATYQKANTMQEAERRKGKRMRLSWCYSFRQVGVWAQLDDKYVARHLRKAWQLVTNELVAINLLEKPAKPPQADVIVPRGEVQYKKFVDK